MNDKYKVGDLLRHRHGKIILLILELSDESKSRLVKCYYWWDKWIDDTNFSPEELDKSYEHIK